jgi:hypothetical protein
MAQKLNPWVAVLLAIIPIANMILFYYWNKGVKAKWKLKIDPVLRTLGLLVPILSLVIFYIFLENLQSKAGRVETPPPWWAIMFIVPFANFVFYLLVAYQVQVALNKLNVETL